MIETLAPRLLINRPIEAVVIPLPTDETTPPVTKMYFGIPSSAWCVAGAGACCSPRWPMSAPGSAPRRAAAGDPHPAGDDDPTVRDSRAPKTPPRRGPSPARLPLPPRRLAL